MARSRSSGTSTARSSGTDIERELRAIYDEVDRAFAGASCPASTECCRFGITGREPYVTSLELAVVERAIAARGGARSLGRSPPPLDAGPDKRRLGIVDERVCPLLDAAGRCAIYASRPFGCRTFFCDRAVGADVVDQREINAFVRRIKDLAAKHSPGGDVGRPLVRALSGPGSKRKPGR